MWSAAHEKVLGRLSSPRRIQDFLDSLEYNTDDVCRCPQQALSVRKAHCLDGALLAAAALERLGHPPLLMDLRAVNDDDHVVALFRQKDLWGAVAKSNTTLLRYRDPVYRSLRELALSYFFAYFNTDGEMSLREYSHPVRLDRFDNWQFSAEAVDHINEALDSARHYALVSARQARLLPRAPGYLLDACFAGSDPDGLFKPKL